MNKDFSDFVKKIKSLSPEYIKRKKAEELDRAKVEYHDFKVKFVKSQCYLCENLVTEVGNKPCLHWLLRPGGVNKRMVRAVLENSDFFQAIAYLRWVASTEKGLLNINDLIDEKSEKSVYEISIKYKKFKWSFTLSLGDLGGHKGRKFGELPHYHFEMRVGGRVVVSFDDFHIKLSDWDIFNIQVRNGEHGDMVWYFPFGESYEDLVSFVAPETLLNILESTDSESKASFHLSTMVEAMPGETISGDELALLAEEHKRTGKPMATLLQKLKSVKVTTIVQPGEGIVDLEKRKKRSR